MTQASRLSIEKQMNKIIITYTEAGLAIAKTIAAGFDVEIFIRIKTSTRSWRIDGLRLKR